MKAIKYILLFVVIFSILGLLIFKCNIGKIVYSYWQGNYKVSKTTTPNTFINIRIMNIFVMSSLSLTFGFFGFRLAKRKKRNPTLWAFLCVLFNVIGYLVLYNLKSKNI